MSLQINEVDIVEESPMNIEPCSVAVLLLVPRPAYLILLHFESEKGEEIS
jgi:hypothetical protein